MRLVSQEEFDSAKSRDAIHLYCDYCGKDFVRLKHHAMKNAKRGRGSCYCSRKCSNASLCTRDLHSCLNCGEETKSKFCSQRCAGIFNRTGQRRVPARYCKNCGKETINAIFCSRECHRKFEEETYIERWLSGDETGLTPGGAVCKQVRNYLLRIHGQKCSRCGWAQVNPASGKVPVQIEHIDGDFRNCSKENLTVLCPNCHSLTPTYMGLNKGRGRDVNGVRRKKLK